MQNGTVTLEDSLAVSFKTTHTLTSKHAPWYLLKWTENLRPHKNLYMDIYSSFIHNCKNLEATMMPYSRWIDKLWYIQTMECYLVLQKMSYQAIGGN